jgi:hypothetical protein
MAKAPFQDPDLHTPAHDAIMMWLEENAEAVIRPHCVVVAGYKDGDAINIETTWEKPVGYRGGVRYVDMMIKATITGSYFPVILLCEVKPVIRSVGELIRQLRQYEPSRGNGTVRVAVVSPDDRFRAIIEKQGFIFIKAPQPEYGPQGGLF